MPSEEQISLPEKIIVATNSLGENADEKIREQLISLINELINNDLNTLLQLLYRIDVDENKIRQYLEYNTHTNSAFILADLIIERQLQKIKSRKQFSGNKNQESEEEKW